MNVRHCLFLYQKGNVTAVLIKNNVPQLMKIKGSSTIAFTENYWDGWIEYAAFCEGDKTDFCIIYDNELTVPDKLTEATCDEQFCIWNRELIIKAMKSINVTSPVEVRTEKDDFVCKAGALRKSDKFTVLTAKFTNAEKEAAVTDKETSTETPLIQYYSEKFKEYKENNK